MKANQKMEHFANFSHFRDFAGMNISLLNSLWSNQFNKTTWILDTGATAHMCAGLSYIEKSCKLDKYIPIYLPDGSIKPVTHKGLITLNSRLI